jgi:hypothetical protein
MLAEGEKGEMRNEAPIVPLCSSLEAFEVFSQYVEKGLSDFAGRPIEIDYGKTILTSWRMKNGLSVLPG